MLWQNVLDQHVVFDRYRKLLGDYVSASKIRQIQKQFIAKQYFKVCTRDFTSYFMLMS